jgi:hypothetical protein
MGSHPTNDRKAVRESQLLLDRVSKSGSLHHHLKLNTRHSQAQHVHHHTSTIHHLKKMPSNIPAEIWNQIIEFIPGHVLWNLRTVNSVFFQAAMDAHYRQVTLFCYNLDSEGWESTLDHWRRLRCVCVFSSHGRYDDIRYEFPGADNPGTGFARSSHTLSTSTTISDTMIIAIRQRINLVVCGY